MTRLYWTLAAVAALGGIAHADEPSVDTADVEPAVEPRVHADMLAVHAGTTETSHRGFTDDYLVMPSGGEIGAQFRLLTAQPVFGPDPVRITDLAIFSLGGRWSAHRRLELAASVDLLPKQPSFTDEKTWQSVSVSARTPLRRRTALAIGGSGGHLLDHSGSWIAQAASVEWRKPIIEFMSFDLAAGMSGVSLTAPNRPSAFVAELTASSRVAFRAPNGVWAGWFGVSYALPVIARGTDPTTDQRVDPQPRLDLRLGTVLAVVKQWDVYAEFAVIDRGDLADPTTRLPILSGGFDQQQIIFGVTRHFEGRPRRGPDRALQLSAR